MLNFLRRLYVSPEQKALQLIVELAELCAKAVTSLRSATQALEKEDFKKHMDMVISYEEEADKVRRATIESLARGALPPLSREDFIRLADGIDLVADSAKDAIRCLHIIPKRRMPRRFLSIFLALLENAVKCSQSLLEAVRWMGKDFKKSLELTHQIEKEEKLADSNHLRCLYELGKCRLDMTSILLWERVIGHVEFITDACEDASDTLECIGARTLRS